ncbi:MAG: hypothetical protein AB8G15_22785 [Saprospiraceae bacterium]
MLNKLLLKFIQLFAPLWRMIGVDISKLIIILRTKLLMDGRRVTSFTQSYQGKNKSDLDLLTMLFYLIMGFVAMFLLFIFKLPTTGISLFLSFWLIIIMFTLVAEFTDVLIDVKDNYILLPRPVDDKTLALSRLLHLFLYLFRLTLAFLTPSIIYLGCSYGFMAACLLVVQSIFVLLLAIFLVNILYLQLLRFTSGKRFKELINYFQIGFIISIITCYYALPKLIDFSQFETINLLEHSARFYIPSIWIGSWWAVVMEGNFSPQTLLLASMGFLVPLFLLYLVTQVLSKKFSQRLIALDENSVVLKKVQQEALKTPALTWKNWLKNKLVSNPTESVGFESVWLITARSRTFKLKTYPLFGIIPGYFIFTAMSGEGTVSERWASLIESDRYIFLIYLAIYGILIPIFNVRFSDQYKASWLYYAMPIQYPGLILKGATKAMIGKFIVPVISIMAIISLSIWGIKTVDDIMLGLINVLLVAVGISRIVLKRMPFSEAWSNQSKGSYTGWNLFSMLFIGVLGFGHWYLLDRPIALVIWGGIGIILILLILRDFKRISWRDMETD